ncbi:hypothetical protein A2950_00415 [Candidatus Kaiserbacteria bacterium RIFCSPLOWO2_01_FULL_55_19]|uniref:Uncharacterized protein n=1 Tax=Candidatus Kaiserbacteria bacterium RIFCSPLOWO2_01_FULL_55_19 TaxID=1798516 RepID=A0A1F6ESF7_9BACT|nr:MAG: hypothetical protein A2950_00415 [Candidatus Kaiserbacteria bacterium RIFCSPLOWO2_01_FULL_55_19]
MPTITIKAMRVDLGSFFSLSLDRLTRPARKEEMNFAECGVCEHEDHYWIGERAQVEGKDVLQVTVLDLLEKRDQEYPSWGDEEVYVIVGRNGVSKEFIWYLLNKEELENHKKSN